ncbi:10331_t:CDS:2 [Ambispora gerdemannii]|uniref:10331_t:CDS:1 n=1 Tax=Ambispora gerdemannii TaxID=144530 RepID=A0A9N9B3Y4_9GLOM|nr:10331_t:CDS:2 [Ambispora gerdemannii]
MTCHKCENRWNQWCRICPNCDISVWTSGNLKIDEKIINAQQSNRSWCNHAVALKEIYNSSDCNPNFLSELAITLGNYNFRKGICEVYGASQDPHTNNYLIVMRYYDEGALYDKLSKKETTLSDIDTCLRSISTVLAKLHNSNVIHQDLHSGNILCSYSQYDIADFGRARMSSEFDTPKTDFNIIDSKRIKELRMKKDSEIHSGEIHKSRSPSPMVKTANPLNNSATVYISREYEIDVVRDKCLS